MDGRVCFFFFFPFQSHGGVSMCLHQVRLVDRIEIPSWVFYMFLVHAEMTFKNNVGFYDLSCWLLFLGLGDTNSCLHIPWLRGLVCG